MPITKYLCVDAYIHSSHTHTHENEVLLIPCQQGSVKLEYQTERTVSCLYYVETCKACAATPMLKCIQFKRHHTSNELEIDYLIFSLIK